MRTLGLDPGTAATGFGIVAFENGRLTLETCGVWRPAARMALPERLDFLFFRLPGGFETRPYRTLPFDFGSAAGA